MSVSSENEPVNLLALDGGGIRGVSELVILNEVMKRVQQKGNLTSLPKPCEYFHLFGGTSTGGLVAIMLGRLEMGTQEALEAYDSFASDIFSKRRPSITEKYKAKALEETVKKLVREQGKGSVMRNRRPAQEKGHAFVCTMPEQRHKETVRLRTYDVTGDKYPNCLIYEAARATTAATTYFKPMPIKDEEGKEEKFVDAALGTNNPISILWDEAVNLFGNKRRLGCVVSLGTGSRKVEMAPGGKKFIEKTKFLISAFKVMKEIGTDSEKDHERWQAKFEEFDNTYFRLNVDGGAQGIELSDWKKIGQLKARTRKYLQNSRVEKMIDDLAEVLLGNKNSGLNLAHGGNLSKETTIPAEPKFIRRGKSSNIFTGRETILDRLDKHFGPREPGDTSRREFHLRGMGGVGKTQIALKFTERNERRFHVLWVDATDAVTILQSYQQIATSIFGPREKRDPVQDVVLWLQKSDEEWLLVFDNAPVSGLTKYLPDGDHGNILYTSRHRNLQPRLRPECVASVEEMNAPEAMLLLLRSAQKPVDVVENQDLARAIVTALGLLPLAIDQAGAYIHMAPCPLEKYLGVFNEQKEELLRSPRFRGSDEKRHVAVYATFNISYRAIKAFSDKKEDLARVKDAEIALKLLNLICFYHNEGLIGTIFSWAAVNREENDRSLHFPLKAGEVELESLIKTYRTEATQELPEVTVWRHEDFIRGIGFLHEFSLLKFDYSAEYINMHILVHDWARDRLDSNEKSDWGLAAKSLLMDSIRLGGFIPALVHRREVIPHLEACMKHVKAEQNDLALESEHLGKISRVFQQASNLDAAEAALTKALEYRKIYFGLLDNGPFMAMSYLARLYEDQGKYCQAREMLLEVIDRRKLYIKEKKWQDSLDRQKNTADDEVHRKPELDDDPLDDEDLRSDTLALGRILIAEDNKLGAADVYEQVLRWNERKYGEQSKQACENRRIVNKFRGISDNQDITVQEAQQEYDTLVAGWGTTRNKVIVAERRLAQMLMSHGALLEAHNHFAHIHQWSEEVHGEGSVRHADAATDLGVSFLKRKMVLDGIKMHMDALPAYGQKLGSSHPKTLRSMKNLALCLSRLADYKSAVDIMQDCLAGLVVSLGESHRKTLTAAYILRQFRLFEESIPDYIRVMVNNKAIAANRDAWGEDAPAWLQKWEPVSVEPMIQARLDRGEPVLSYKMEKVDIEDSSFSYYRMTPDEEIMGPQVMERALQWQD